MNLADRVKKRRLELGLSQEEAATRAGMKQQSWGSIEKGDTKKPRNIVSIAAVLDCDPSWLMTGTNIIPLGEVNTRKIPLISYAQVSEIAEGTYALDLEGKFEYILSDVDCSANSFALRIVGDSMNPEFVEGDIIIIDPEVKPSPGEFVIAKHGSDEATFKKYRPSSPEVSGLVEFDLVPLNDDYPTISNKNLPITIIGTMVEHRIFRRKR